MTGSIEVRRHEGIVTLEFNNPSRRNAISLEMYAALEEECARLASDDSARTLVLRGAGGHFAGGTDIGDLTSISTGADGVRYEAHMRRVQHGFLDLRIPIIAVVEGACVGGGLVLAAISDLVLCTPDARFGSPIAFTLGNTLSAASLARLSATFGRRLAMEMLLTGRLVDASWALEAGFVTRVVDAADMQDALQEILTRIQQAAPLTLASFKEFERRVDSALLEIQVDDVYERVYGSDDFREGVSAFLERRAPRFSGQ